MAGHSYIFALAFYCGTVLIQSLEVSTLAYNITNNCPDVASFENITLLEMDSTSHPTDVGITYYLYKSNQSNLTWCQSYKVCKQNGQRLAVLDTKDLQQNMFTLNVSDITKIWIAGRRKDYGIDWTWIDDALTDKAENFTVYETSDTKKDCARVTLVRSGAEETTADSCGLKKTFICFDNKRLFYSNETISWYEAMNWCVSRGGRLGTLQHHSKKDGNTYWTGLYRRPWLWIESDQDVHPVLSSVWLTTGEGDCLTTLANGSWMATDCDEKLQYVMCEEHLSPTTEPSILESAGVTDDAKCLAENMCSAEETWVIVISVIAAVVVAIIILGIAVGITRGRRAKQRNNRRHAEGVNNPAADGYCEAQEGQINMAPPESAAYRPNSYDNSVTPYAEVRIPQQLSCPEPEPVYTLASEVPPPYDAVVYSTVHKRSEDTTSLQNVRPKQAPPKPKRQPPM